MYMERCTNLGLLILDRQVEFKLSWKLILRVQSVGEIHPPYPTVSMNLRGETEQMLKREKGILCQILTIEKQERLRGSSCVH